MGESAGVTWAPDLITITSNFLPLKYFPRTSDGKPTVLRLENIFFESFNIMFIR